ncbi:MAG: hypothetical protein ACT4PJ_16190 [Gemmatimonadaceae bacterium]
MTGRVVRPAGDSASGVAGAWVVLHRVGSDSAGPLDSVRTGRGGRFSIRFATGGSVDAIYFVSAEHAGIAYFSPPLDAARAVQDTELAVFDTTSAPVPIHVRGRHIVLTAPENDRSREVVEVYELANDSSVTRVAAGEMPVWAATLPDGATDVRLGQSDLSADAIRTDGGRVRLFAPLAPGLKQLSLAYRLHARTFPLSLPIDAHADLLEVLLEEPNATASAPGLQRVDPVSVETRTFNRFLGQDVASGGVLRIEVPGTSFVSRGMWVLVIVVSVALAMTLVLLRVLRRRPAPARISVRPPGDERPAERLARQIAELDARMERTADLTETDRAAYARRRAELKSALATALDDERRRG